VPTRWSDVALDAGTLMVAQQRTSANSEEASAEPKVKSHRQLLVALGPAWTDSGHLFVDEAGVEYHPQRFT
jgi:hypothetical protein